MFYLLFTTGILYCALGLILLIFQTRHILSVLICLEIIIFGVLVVMFSQFLCGMVDTLLCLVSMTIAVCEGCVGLGLLVLVVRVHGSDCVSRLNSYI